MSELVVVVFDLHEGKGKQYEKVEETLANLGLSRTVTGDGGKQAQLPRSTYMAPLAGQNAIEVREKIRSAIEKAMIEVEAKGDVFIAIGGNWAWCAEVIGKKH